MATFAHSPSLISISILFLLTLGNSLNFKIDSFGYGTTNIAYEGDAVSSLGTIQLINKVDNLYRAGWATYTEKVQIWDSSTGKLTDFVTHFSFNIDTQGRGKYGQGLVFFLSPVDFHIPPNSVGSFLGLFNTTTIGSSSNQIVAVEFDSFHQHVGININSIASTTTTPWNASLYSGDTGDVWISYNSSYTNLWVSLSYQTTPNIPKNLSLSYKIDLRNVLPEQVKIGFSAATDQYVESNTIQSWAFNSSLATKESSLTKGKHVWLILGVTIPSGGIFILGFVIISVFIWNKSRKKIRSRKSENLTSINYDLEEGAGPRRFAYNYLATATNNFSDDRKLGEGGFGCVYKGYLHDRDLTIAVKRISRGSRQGKKEYVTEVKTISQLRHKNLVRLIGWNHDQAQFLVVYEFMPNGSLDAHLFGRRAPLTWAVRYKVTLGLASALLYLHEEWEQCVVHRDIKSSNVMLDSNFDVKLGDFGLARLMDHELGPRTTGIAGTPGYLAPDYIRTGRASKESDVYSFGVVILEIVTGRRSTDPNPGELQIGLVERVWDLYGRGEIFQDVDERLNGNFDIIQIECLVAVGLRCAHPDPDLRPSIRQAIQVLHFEAMLPNLPARMPVATYQVPGTCSASVDPSITFSSMEVGR